MHDLYASVPSPPEPSYAISEDGYYDDAHKRLSDYEEPAGVRTRLFKYQIVSPNVPRAS